MATGRHRSIGKESAISNRSYRGPDRRDPNAANPVEVTRTVRHDDKGNPVLEVRAVAPRRRNDDDTIDLLKCLDPEALQLSSRD